MPDNLMQLYLEMIVKMVEQTPNNMELGEKVRQLYWDKLKDFTDKK